MALLTLVRSAAVAPEDEVERLRQERDLYLRLLQLGAQEELEPFLEEALGLVVEVTGAERGYLEVRDPGSDRAFSIARGCSSEELDDIRGHVSRGIIAEALATGRTVVTQSALLDERFRERESVRAAKIEAVLCAPVGGRAALGAVYLQGRTTPGPFSAADEAQAERLARHLAPLADRLLVRRRIGEETDATRPLRERYRLETIVGRSEALAAALEQAMLAAPLDVNVLLTGPSGTGKSQLARVIHDNSRRHAGPFVELNCAAIPETLLESELFGARKGSHSEARRDIPGKVEAAEGGTLFLDEVADLPFEAQAKLLQLLQSREYYPLGATRPERADVRLIAATNRDLEDAVAGRRFREDLLYRLQVLPVRLPSLAERKADLEPLAAALLRRVAARHGLSELPLTHAARRALVEADWPGNVRQLENALEAAAIRAAGEGSGEIAARHVFPERRAEEPTEDAGALSFHEATRRFQRRFLEEMLEHSGWNVTETARRIELARSHVYNLMDSLDIARGERARRAAHGGDEDPRPGRAHGGDEAPPPRRAGGEGE
jgi:Nif-specific regulatory protein